MVCGIILAPRKQDGAMAEFYLKRIVLHLEKERVNPVVMFREDPVKEVIFEDFGYGFVVPVIGKDAPQTKSSRFDFVKRAVPGITVCRFPEIAPHRKNLEYARNIFVPLRRTKDSPDTIYIYCESGDCQEIERWLRLIYFNVQVIIIAVNLTNGEVALLTHITKQCYDESTSE